METGHQDVDFGDDEAFHDGELAWEDFVEAVRDDAAARGLSVGECAACWRLGVAVFLEVGHVG